MSLLLPYRFTNLPILTIFMSMREVQINRNLILREDGRLFNIHTGEEYIPPICNRYYVVAIKHITKRVHRLVMEYFGPPQPSPEYQIDHINRNPLDNRLENLRWVTCKENQNNRKSNLPIGQRRCDINDDKLYYYLRNKENHNKRRARKDP